MLSDSEKYQNALQKLYQVNLFGGMKLGLDNMRQFDRLLNFPSKKFRSVHIAGTNGKGGVAHKMAAACRGIGLKTALYTSPHIATFRERIQINGKLIPQKAVTEGLERLFALVESSSFTPTFFEYTTLLAFDYFANEQVDIAIIETGLGGRLDATNIITPLLSIITSISLDHTGILGNTIEEIAREKAGILKPGVPFVLGPTVPLPGAMTERFNSAEPENRAIASNGLKLLPFDFSKAIIDQALLVRPPCRQEIHSFNNIPVIVDVAHNPASIHELLEFAKKRFPDRKLYCAFAFSKDKDYQTCLRMIDSTCEKRWAIENSHPRLASFPAEQTLRIDQILHDSAIKDGVLLICGTFFIMADALNALGIEIEMDPFDLNEKTSSSRIG
jgi:dihydrofolate synthase/folylpolyglutamate synthase